MIFGYKANKCKVQIDGVQTETKTYSSDTGNATAYFKRVGNVVTVDLTLTASANNNFAIITGNIVAPDWAKYTGEGNIRAANYVSNGDIEAKCNMARTGTGNCYVSANCVNSTSSEASINISMTYIVD